MKIDSRFRQCRVAQLWSKLTFLRTEQKHLNSFDDLSIYKKCMRLNRSNLLATWVIVLVQPLTANAESLRCGTKLISEGDLAIQVREKCGDPISEELLGYTLRGASPGFRGEREYKIEQWIYGPDQGYYHVLIFEAGRLHDIDNVKQ